MALTITWSWSPSKAAFYPNELKAMYVAAGTWPADAEPVATSVRDAHALPLADGKMLAADANGQPTRVAIPTPAAGH